MTTIFGVDLGQAQDYTAIAAVEAPGLEDATASVEFQVRHLERERLGTSYPAVVSRITKLTRAVPKTHLVVDATGVGRPIVDLLHEEGLQPVAVSITGGKIGSIKDGIFRVPKRDLVRTLHTLLARGRLKVAKRLPAGEAFRRELRAFERTISDRGFDSYSGRGEHDDLVIAVALAVWHGETRLRRREIDDELARKEESRENILDRMDELAANGGGASLVLLRERYRDVGREIGALRIERRRLIWTRRPFVQPNLHR